MEIDFQNKEQGPVNDFVSIPAGRYVCRVGEVRVGTTRNGDERWALRLVVAEGEYLGRQAAWDGIVFSQRGKSRARAVLGALGLPNEGKVQIEPGDLQDRRALVEVRPVEFDQPNGEKVRRNEVPYNGFLPVPEDPEESAPEATKDIPF